MKIKRHAYIFYISCIIVSIFSTCRYFHPKEEEKATVVATVDNENLTIEYIANLIPSSLTPEDSISFVEKFVDDWIKKQLMIKEAEEKIDFNKAQIKKKVLDYQYALMVHEFEQSYIELNLNKKVNEREIIQYYEENSDNFVLRETLVKCIYFKIPKKTSGISRFRVQLRKFPKDSLEIIRFVDRHADKSFLESSIWVSFDEVLRETPLKDKGQISNHSLLEMSDENFIYFVKIFNKHKKSEVAPIEYVKNQIKEIILNKRKINLKYKLEKNIYEEATKKGSYQIFLD